MRTTLFAIVSLSLFAGCASGESARQWYEQGARAVAERSQQQLNTNRAKNVILFVADGMGISTITAARIFDGQSRGESGEENTLSFERFPHVALVKTYSTDSQVPDSAGTATAMTTGIKTGLKIIAQHDTQRDQCYGASADFPKTVIEYAEEKGIATGIVSTTEITHATPAAAYAHVPVRNWQSDKDIPEKYAAMGCQDIATQLVNFPHGDGIEVALGGGKAHFQTKAHGGVRKNGDLIDGWKNKYRQGAFVEDADSLKSAAMSKQRIFGLFSKGHMAYEYDRANTRQPSLADMTIAAINVLSRNEKGYFLMVESGRVDHAHHETNAYRALSDVQQFSRAVENALEMVDLDETLVLVTADHSHVFTMAGYPERGNPILGFVATTVNHMRELSMALDDQPYTTLAYANGPNAVDGDREMPDEDTVRGPDYVQQATIELPAETHSGEDVALFAIGLWAHLAAGVIEQHEIFHIIDYAMKLTR